MSGHSHGAGGHGHSPSKGVRLTHSHGHGVAVEQGFVQREVGEDVPSSVALPRGAGGGKILFLDMASGIAGDMFIAALCDLGVPLDVISDAVNQLKMPKVRLELRAGYAGAIGCQHFRVSWEEQGKERSFSEIQEMINRSSLDDELKVLSLQIFRRLALAEAEVHRTSVDEVHFHEVGAVDAIVDIVGAAAAVIYLGAKITASPVPLGRGFVKCRHGVLPLPAPATLNCLRGIPTIPSGIEAELVTPTGAAIVATLAQGFADWFTGAVERVGFGAGTRGLPDRPNVLRVVLAKEQELLSQKTHTLLEANIDDMTGEAASYAMERILSSGALDAWILAATMKKGRPGMIFCALCNISDTDRVTKTILEHTTSIGVRQMLVERSEQPREFHVVETRWGEVRVKVSGNGSLLERKEKPEFEDCAKIAQKEGIPLRIVLAEVAQICASKSRHSGS